MNIFDWKWNLADVVQDKDIKVFSTFSCGGGSCMGYKRAGFEVIGNVEIDPKINDMYVRNNHPKYNYCMDLREFNKLDDLPEELYHLDILDGSPPCTTFSTAGKREKTWGKKKKFREGQAEQTLDDLFFVFLDTVEKLRPKVVIAENVVGLIKGNAKGYVHEIIRRFKVAGYDVQIFQLNSAFMDVPQARHRVFFVANNQGYAPIRLKFENDPISFGAVRSGEGRPLSENAGVQNALVMAAKPGDQTLSDVADRIAGEGTKYFSHMLIWDDQVVPTVIAGGGYIRMADRTMFAEDDFRNVQSFPQDYDFCGNSAQYVCGMSVPPNMMANIAKEVYEQWLK